MTDPLPDNLHVIDQQLAELRNQWLSANPRTRKPLTRQIDQLLERRLEVARTLPPTNP